MALNKVNGHMWHFTWVSGPIIHSIIQDYNGMNIEISNLNKPSPSHLPIPHASPTCSHRYFPSPAPSPSLFPLIHLLNSHACLFQVPYFHFYYPLLPFSSTQCSLSGSTFQSPSSFLSEPFCLHITSSLTYLSQFFSISLKKGSDPDHHLPLSHCRSCLTC